MDELAQIERRWRIWRWLARYERVGYLVTVLFWAGFIVWMTLHERHIYRTTSPAAIVVLWTGRLLILAYALWRFLAVEKKRHQVINAEANSLMIRQKARVEELNSMLIVAGRPRIDS